MYGTAAARYGIGGCVRVVRRRPFARSPRPPRPPQPPRLAPSSSGGGPGSDWRMGRRRCARLARRRPFARPPRASDRPEAGRAQATRAGRIDGVGCLQRLSDIVTAGTRAVLRSAGSARSTRQFGLSGAARSGRRGSSLRDRASCVSRALRLEPGRMRPRPVRNRVPVSRGCPPRSGASRPATCAALQDAWARSHVTRALRVRRIQARLTALNRAMTSARCRRCVNAAFPPCSPCRWCARCGRGSL